MSLISPLDTVRFGFPIAKLNPASIGELEQGLNSLDGSGCRLVISKVDLEQLSLIHHMQDIGFRTMDVQSTYAFELKNLGQAQTDLLRSDVKVAPYHPSQREDIATIARESFMGYGHYAASGKFDLDTCADIYVDWALRSCEDNQMADVMLVAECDGSVAGFLGFKTGKKDGRRFAAGVLGAVSSEFRGRDIFRILTVAGLQWGQNLGLQWEEHNVLCTNYPVNRSFSGLGFRIIRSFTTMHLWL